MKKKTWCYRLSGSGHVYRRLGGLRIDRQTVEHRGIRGRLGHHDQGQNDACRR